MIYHINFKTHNTMKTVKKTATEAKTPRYVVSTLEGIELNASNKELAQQRVEELQSNFTPVIYFDDHKEKIHWVYQKTPTQKNYRVFMGHYVAPVKEIVATVEPEDLV
jgi:fructose/tagatose bisphosphate aldolase